LPGTLPVSVSVRFKPSIWGLILAVLLGSLFGSVLYQLYQRISKQDSNVSWYALYGLGLAAGVIAEFLALVLVMGNSQFRLLGFELDPYQLLPAGLIGALIALVGCRNSGDLLKLLKQNP